jgi:hypothetical protein
VTIFEEVPLQTFSMHCLFVTSSQHLRPIVAFWITLPQRSVAGAICSHLVSVHEVFSRVGEIAKSDCYPRHICLSARNNSGPLDEFSLNFIIIFRKFVENVRVPLKNLTRITCTVHEHIRTFNIVSCRVVIKMRNDSDRSCRENRNTQFMFNNFCPTKIMPYMR